jgi:hypothetical protein
VAEMSARFWAELVSDWEIDILKVPIYSPLAGAPPHLPVWS